MKTEVKTEVKTTEEICNEYYPYLINDLLKFIERVKKLEFDNQDPSSSLIDIINQYSISKGIQLDIITDAITDDVYLQEYIKKDCEVRGIVESNYIPEEIW